MTTTRAHGAEITFETKDRATLVKRGRTVIGRVVRKDSSGKLHYYSDRRGNHVFLNGMPNVMVAKREHQAAWGMDAALVRRLKRLGVVRTHMLWKDLNRQKDYSCSIDAWTEEGETKDYGHAPQHFLRFNRFVVRDATTRERLRPWQ